MMKIHYVHSLINIKLLKLQKREAPSANPSAKEWSTRPTVETRALSFS